MAGELTGAGFPRPVPVAAALGGVVLGTPTPPRPAIFPLAPRFAWQVEVCVVVREGTIEVVARDVLEALGRETGDWGTDPSHATTGEPGWKYSSHAAARTWSLELVHDIVDPMAEYDETAAAFVVWLEQRVADLVVLGLDTVERRVVHGTGQKREPDAVEPAIGPAFYSVAATAKILSRDPGIGVIGRDTLFELLNKWSWIHRANDAWRPEPTLLTAGVLMQQDVHVTQYSKSEPYPQVLITPLGIEALHAKLGGTATLDLANASHLTLI